jgi:hypothetical protein
MTKGTHKQIVASLAIRVEGATTQSERLRRHNHRGFLPPRLVALQAADS